MRCAVLGCNSDNQAKKFSRRIKFFRFPAENSMIEAWKNVCNPTGNINITLARVCSRHFTDTDYIRNLREEMLGYCNNYRRQLKTKAVPSQKLDRDNVVIGDSTNRNTLQEKALPATKDIGDNVVIGDSTNRNTLQEKALPATKDIGDNGVIGDSTNRNTLQEKALPATKDIGDIICNIDNGVIGENIKSKGLLEKPLTATKDIGVNTDTEDDQKLIAELFKQNKQLQENEISLQTLISELKKENEQLKHNQKSLQKLFSPIQLKKLEHANRRVCWSVEDVSQAIVHYSAGPRAYRFLLKKGYPFPAVSTLRCRLKKIKIAPGILKQVFNVVKLLNLNKIEKVCVLSFDEIKIRKVYIYDKANDETLMPYSYAQVVMLRGLFGNWKQPIFFDYDCKLTKDILFDIINFVESCDFQVVAMVSDLGGGNIGLRNELGINCNKTWFQNPANDIEKIYVFADVPHLLKLIRNNFLDHGFIIDGQEVNKSVVAELLQITNVSDLNIAHKISELNLTVIGPQRQKVKLAAKLFSHTVSKAITRCGMLGGLQNNNWTGCDEFFKLVNDWFDCFNSRVPVADARDRKKAYGLALDTQIKIIDKMTQTMKQLRVKESKFLYPFQRGIIISNNSLKLLYEDLQRRFDIKYLLTYRLNQDVLENFFGILRAKGGLHDCPDPLEFKYRLRAYILGKNEGNFSACSNVEVDNTPDLLTTEVSLSTKCFAKFDIPGQDTSDIDFSFKELDNIAYDGLENLAGYICHKLKEEIGENSSQPFSFTWVDHLSEGGLSKPSETLMKEIQKLEVIFDTFNGDKIVTCKNYLQQLFQLSNKIECSEKVKKLFFRSRMYFRMKKLNQILLDTTVSRKRKMRKIIL